MLDVRVPKPTACCTWGGQLKLFYGNVSDMAIASLCSNHYVASFEPRLVPLSKLLYHTCCICGQRCKCWSRRPKLTSSVISDVKHIIYIFTYGQKLWKMYSVRVVVSLESQWCTEVLAAVNLQSKWTLDFSQLRFRSTKIIGVWPVAVKRCHGLHCLALVGVHIQSESWTQHLLLSRICVLRQYANFPQDYQIGEQSIWKVLRHQGFTPITLSTRVQAKLIFCSCGSGISPRCHCGRSSSLPGTSGVNFSCPSSDQK